MILVIKWDLTCASLSSSLVVVLMTLVMHQWRSGLCHMEILKSACQQEGDSRNLVVDISDALSPQGVEQKDIQRHRR